MRFLRISLNHDAEDVLAGFPFEEDQYIDQVYEDVVIVALGDATDTTSAQEQFLNTHPDVIAYKVGEEVQIVVSGFELTGYY